MCSTQNLKNTVAGACDASTCLAITRQDHRDATNWSKYMFLNISPIFNVITEESIYTSNMAVLIKHNNSK